jgi:hypothetical protein
VIFNFAIHCKVHFSLEIQRKTILNTASVNCFHRRRKSALSRDVERARHASPPYARRARMLRHRRTHRSMRRAGELLCLTSVGAWTVPSGCFPLAGVPTAARHWAPAPLHIAAPCYPCRACTGDVVDPRTP